MPANDELPRTSTRLPHPIRPTSPRQSLGVGGAAIAALAVLLSPAIARAVETSSSVPATATPQDVSNGMCNVDVTEYCVVSLQVDGGAAPDHIIAEVLPPLPGTTLVNILVLNTANVDAQELSSDSPAGLTVNSNVNVVIQLPADYEPALALSSGLLEAWDFDPDANQVTLLSQPRSSSLNVTDGCDLFFGCAEQAEIDFESFLVLNVDQFSVSPDDAADVIAAAEKSEGMAISTNAQTFGIPVFFAGDLVEFALTIAAPHLKADGSLNAGFFEVFLPSPLLTEVWGLDLATLTPGSFRVELEENEVTTSVTVQIEDKAASASFPAGKVLSFDDFSFSAPTVKLAPNVAPVATDDTYVTNEDAALTVAAAAGVLANDTDLNDDSLTATKTSDPATGSLTLNNDGSFTYTPPANLSGPVSFKYKADDGELDSGEATVTINVSGVNDAPVAASDSYSTGEDQTLIIDAASGVLANDSDVDGDPLTAAKTKDPSNGTLTFNADGSFAYVPNTDFKGTDSFSYKADDGELDSGEATVTINVSGVNDAPVATSDSYSTGEDQTLIIDAGSGVLANDSDVDGDSLTAAKTKDPSNGTLTFNADGSFVYVPNTNFNGTDSFRYKASDSELDSGEATVTINVDTVNDAPMASDDTYTMVSYETLLASSVLSNDSDADGDPMTAALVSSTTRGVLAFASDGTFTYRPNGGFFGDDSFTYRASDGTAESDTATVTINVTECRYALSSSAATVSRVGGALTVDVRANGESCPWSATSNSAWIVVQSVKLAGEGPGSATLQVDENLAGIDRTGTVAIAGLTFTIDQPAARCQYALSMSMASYSSDRATDSVVVDATPGCAWTAVSDAGWVNVGGGSGPVTGSGPGELRYTVAANTDSARRRATIDVEGRTLRVFQELAGAATPAPAGDLSLRAALVRGGRGGAKVVVRWKDNADDETGYLVKRTEPDASRGNRGTSGGAAEIFQLATNRTKLRDKGPDGTGLSMGTTYCYKVMAFNDAGRSGPVRGCITTPTVDGTLPGTGSSVAISGPIYIVDRVPITLVDRKAPTPPRLPLVRVYKTYEPWGVPGVEIALEQLGYVHGETLFVHPVADLVAIPGDTEIVIVPSASDGNAAGHIGAVNEPDVQQAMRGFVRSGGTLILNRWAPGPGRYRIPSRTRANHATEGYATYLDGGGLVYATRAAVDHPVVGPPRRYLDALLDGLTNPAVGRAR